MQPDGANHETRAPSLFVPLLGLSGVASTSAASPDRCVSSLGTVMLVGIVALAVLSLLHWVLCHVMPLRTTLAVGTVALALWVVALVASGWLGLLPLVLYAVLWYACFQSFVEGCAWVASLPPWEAAKVGASAAASLVLGAAAGACIGPHVKSVAGFEGFLAVLVLAALATRLPSLLRGRFGAARRAPDSPGMGVGACDAVPVSDGAFAPCSCGCTTPYAPSEAQGDEPSGRDLDTLCAELSGRFRLTARERDVLPYLARGFTASYCARELGLAEPTIRTHMHNIYNKMGVYTSDGLIRFVHECLGCPARRSARMPTGVRSRPSVPVRPASGAVRAAATPVPPSAPRGR